MSEGIRVNMSAKEGKSVTLEPLPNGRYLMSITDIDLVEVAAGDNEGKPMFKVELTVQDGDYENRKAWTNVMLFDGALFSLSQMLKAQGVEVRELGDRAEFQVPGFDANVVPGPEWWMSKQFVVRIKIMPKRKDKKTGKEYAERAEVKGFSPAKDWDPKMGVSKVVAGVGAAKSSRPSMLP